MNATQTPELSDAEMHALLDVAASSVRTAVLDRQVWRPSLDTCTVRLREPGAAFVTLHLDGRLRGCVGTLAGGRPLVVTVADVARDAALADPRFPPVEPIELRRLRLDVSVLSAPEPMDVHSYGALVDAIRPGIDGLVVEAGGRRATLLPSVWEDLPTAPQFVAALWRKAGLDAGIWPWDTRVSRYTAQVACAASALA